MHQIGQQIGQTLIPRKIDFDSSPLNIQSDTSFFMKGIEVDWINDGSGTSNAGEIKPMQSNELYCSVQLPDGVNKCIGFYFYEEATEGYVFVYNSNKKHLIYRLEGITGQCRVVYRFCSTEFTDFITDNPRDYFNEGRIALKSLCKILPDGSKELYKEIVFSNKKIPNARLVVEDSIATDSFTTPFFTPKNDCCGDCSRLIKVGVPTPMADIKVKEIAVTPADLKEQNELFYKMFKFRFKDINAWGQVSEHGKISEPYLNAISACSKDTANSPHCVWLETKTPCPEIIKRIIEVQTCTLKGETGVTDGSLLSDWKEYATIDLYDQGNPNLKWYERQYKTNNSEFEFFNGGKDIRFKFCNNRECKTIPLSDIRDENPVPFTSGSVASLGKGFIYGDNETDFDKLAEEDKKGISFELVPSTGCEIKYSRIKVYAVIHNFQSSKQNQVIWQFDGKIGFGGYVRGTANTRVFGPAATQNQSPGGGWGQFFPEGVAGFRGILAGTGYMAESKQKLWTPTDFIEVGVQGLNGTINAFVEGLRFGEAIAVHEFDFGLVPCGEYLFRLVGHSDTENLESTSTFYFCTTSWNGYKLNGVVTRGDFLKEIYIDTSAGNDYDGTLDDKVAVILDSASHDGDNVCAISGYLYEDKFNRQPIEMAEVFQSIRNNPSYFLHSKYTDHNGFYFGVAVGEHYMILKGYNRCSPNVVLAETLTSYWSNARIERALFATDRFPNYVTDLCNRYIITGTIKECGLSTGVAGMSIILGRSKPVVSSGTGQFRVVAHFNQSRGTNLLIFSVGASCNVMDCNCKPLKISLPITQPPCLLPGCFESILTVGNFNVNTIIRRGFEHGSRVPIGIMAHDWLGRHTDIQDIESWVVNIPTEQEQGNSTYPRIKVNLPVTFSQAFINTFKYLTFFFGKNVAYEDFFEWAADKVEFIDSAGIVNAANPSKVKIWYRGLNEYNLVRGFKTNTTWKILDTIGNSRVGDIVEFIQNADSIYLPVGLTGIIQYDKDGTYFLIDYDPALRILKDGVRFKFKRPYLCETPRAYYEHSFTINFCGKDGIPRDDNGNTVNSFFLDGFTAYMQPRQIPVITDVIEIIPATGGGTQEKITQKKEIKVYPFSFEHHSPSDTWGDHCFSGGRVGFKNPYEGKKCNRNQLLLTGALNYVNDGAINYLHYFSLTDELQIDEQGWGGIQAIIVKNDGQIMLICENTTFSLAYNDDRARVTADGYVRLPINNRFSKPEKDDSFSFGCQSKDLNTIRRNGPIVMFLDAEKCAVVLHNFASAIDVSNGIKSWITEGVKKSIGNNDIYFHGQFDNKGSDRVYHLTRFDNKLNQFVNQEIDLDLSKNETVAYSFRDKAWLPMRHFTPEYFGNMYGEKNDTQFFSFKNAVAYLHHNSVTPNTIYLNYFGVQCIPVIGVVSNIESTKVKSYLYNEVYCSELLFVIEKILTEMGQKSKLLEGAWEWGEGFSSAAYLCDTEFSTDPDAVVNGDTLYGRWMKSTYIPEPGYKGTFFKLTAIMSFVFPREKSGKS